MKTCKNFCDKYLLKMKKEEIKINNQLKKLVTLTRKRLKKATKEEKKELGNKIKHLLLLIKDTRKASEKVDWTNIYRSVCEKQFCNPGCKGTIFGPSKLKNDFYVKVKNADYLRNEGAISGCIVNENFVL